MSQIFLIPTIRLNKVQNWQFNSKLPKYKWPKKLPIKCHKKFCHQVSQKSMPSSVIKMSLFNPFLGCLFFLKVDTNLTPRPLARCAMKLAIGLASCLPFVTYAWNAGLIIIITEEQSIELIFGYMKEHPEERSWLKVRAIGPQPSFCHSKGSYLRWWWWWWCTRFLRSIIRNLSFEKT